MYKLLFFIFFSISVYSQEFTILSWNISNFGKSKTTDEIRLIADIVKNSDIVCLQEVVTSFYGAQKVVEVLSILNEKGVVWDYSLSDITNSTGNRAERYVFFWRKAKFKINRKFELESVFKDFIEREPYIGSFTFSGFEFKIFNFHALPKKFNPESEIKFFKNYPKVYGNHLFFVGDFNCNERNSVFIPLYRLGFLNVFNDQKTTLKQKCNPNGCLANAYDNIFFNTSVFELVDFKPILFYEEFTDLKVARKLSDHIPISATFRIKKAEN